MRKIVIHRPGGYEELKLETHPDPAPGPGEVLVEVEAAGVNYADCIVRWGLYDSAKKFVGWPITPGFEFAGTVAGSKVFGVTRFGAYSSRVAVPRHQVFSLPTGWTPAQAAGFPAVFLTAYHALYQNMRLRPGMCLLVHSAAGGVGCALLQIGRLSGCRMIGVVGASHKVQTALDNGAHEVIDKSRQDWAQEARRLAPEGYDVVLDGNGAATLRESFALLASSGKLFTYGFHSMFPKKGGRVNYLKLAWDYLRTPRFSPLALTNANKSVIAFNLSFLFHRKDLMQEAMADLTRWIAEGKIKPLPVSCYPVWETARAHEALESGKTTGKLVLTFAPDAV